MVRDGQANDLVKSVRDAFESQQHATWLRFIEGLDPSVHTESVNTYPTTGVQSKPLLCADGELIEKAACNFTHSRGDSLPPAASERNPQLAGKPFSASSLSIIVHPRHPRIPTVHMNVRFFHVEHDEGHWHFGGGMDLTPHFLYAEDAKTWHEHARQACSSQRQYETFKTNCDEYFYLPHRQEARGIGGLFFDDLNEPDFSTCFDLAVNVCEAFRTAYTEVFQRRKQLPFSDSDEDWMLHRRSRYAEFNLIHDRGTKYGLQSGRRVESVLASMPPRANWEYDRQPSTREQSQLLDCLRQPRDWV